MRISDWSSDVCSSDLVVTVKNGFARNFLLPNNKALRANEANRKVFEANRAKIESDNAERRTAAEGRAKDFDGKQIVLIRQASNTGQPSGSVSVRDIVDALSSVEPTSELQSLMRTSYADFCLTTNKEPNSQQKLVRH